MNFFEYVYAKWGYKFWSDFFAGHFSLDRCRLPHSGHCCIGQLMPSRASEMDDAMTVFCWTIASNTLKPQISERQTGSLKTDRPILDEDFSSSNSLQRCLTHFVKDLVVNKNFAFPSFNCWPVFFFLAVISFYILYPTKWGKLEQWSLKCQR